MARSNRSRSLLASWLSHRRDHRRTPRSPVLWWEAKLSLSRAQLIIKAAAGQSNFHARPYPSFVRRNASQCLAKFRGKSNFSPSIFLHPFLFLFLSFFSFLVFLLSRAHPLDPAPSSLQRTSKSLYFYRLNVRRTFIESFSSEVSSIRLAAQCK